MASLGRLPLLLVIVIDYLHILIRRRVRHLHPLHYLILSILLPLVHGLYLERRIEKRRRAHIILKVLLARTPTFLLKRLLLDDLVGVIGIN